MKLIIDIPEDMLEWFKNGEIVDEYDKSALKQVFQNGTPLPKGYGRLGDLDALRKEVSSWGMNDYEPSDFIDEIDKAHTIIKADEESEE